MKPLIGVLANYSDDERIGTDRAIGAKGQDWQVLANDYIKSIEKAGGCPVILPIVDDYRSLLRIIESLDGIIFSGGSDIDPAFYGEAPSYHLGGICPERDFHEIQLAKYIIEEKDIPVLGICRGMQVINIAMGGSLYQDLGTENPEAFRHSLINFPKYYPSHIVNIVKDSKLSSIFQKESIKVNSFHHQAVKVLAPNFKIAMEASDGVIEAMEMDGDRFLIALQWHPEMMIDRHPEYILLFKEFVNECSKLKTK